MKASVSYQHYGGQDADTGSACLGGSVEVRGEAWLAADLEAGLIKANWAASAIAIVTQKIVLMEIKRSFETSHGLLRWTWMVGIDGRAVARTSSVNRNV
jgi:hypothetical protein